jgi:hypothetical protein
LSGGYTTDETIHDFFNLKDHLTRKNTIDEIPQQLHTDLHHQSNHLARTALQIIPKRKNHYRWLEGYFIDQQHTFINQRQKNPMIKSATISFALTKMSGKNYRMIFNRQRMKKTNIAQRPLEA